MDRFAGQVKNPRILHVTFCHVLYTLKARTHLTDLPLADSNSRLIPVGRFQWPQNMFDRESRRTITESVVESADSTTDSAKNPLKIGLWVWAFIVTVDNLIDRFFYSFQGTPTIIIWHLANVVEEILL